MNIEDLTKKNLREAQTITITGLILKDKFKDIITIIPCFCVQDSPNNPCLCTNLSKIFISKENLIGEICSIDKKTNSGEELSSVTVDRNAKILVEKTTSIEAEKFVSATKTSEILPSPTLPLPLPPISWPTWPNPDPILDPKEVYFLAGLAAKYGPAALAAAGAVIGGWLAGGGGKSCSKETTTETTQNPDGSITTRTTTLETCK